MKNNDTILKYLLHDLTPDDKNDFEKLLEDSNDLKIELEETRKLLNNIDNLKSIQLDDSYFNNLIPKVHEKMNQKNSFTTSLNFKLAFSAVFSIFIIFVMFSYQGSSKTKYSFDNLLQDVAINEITTDYEINSLLDENVLVNYEYVSNVEENNFIEELNVNSFSQEDEYNTLKELSNNDVEEIYKQILNKKIL